MTLLLFPLVEVSRRLDMIVVSSFSFLGVYLKSPPEKASGMDVRITTNIILVLVFHLRLSVLRIYYLDLELKKTETCIKINDVCVFAHIFLVLLHARTHARMRSIVQMSPLLVCRPILPHKQTPLVSPCRCRCDHCEYFSWHVEVCAQKPIMHDVVPVQCIG